MSDSKDDQIFRDSGFSEPKPGPQILLKQKPIIKEKPRIKEKVVVLSKMFEEITKNQEPIKVYNYKHPQLTKLESNMSSSDSSDEKVSSAPSGTVKMSFDLSTLQTKLIEEVDSPYE